MTRTHPVRPRPWTPVFAVLGALLLAPAPDAAAMGAPVRAGMDSRFVHRIKLYDGEDRVMNAQSREPYSSRHTCGKCHDYERIAAGSHFRTAATAGGATPGEPWIVSDPATGTQIGISPWAGPGPFLWRPADIGMTDYEFATRFGRHHPGGGPLEWLQGQPKEGPDEPAGPGGPALDRVPSPSKPRWRLSGSLEIDCLLCHSAGLHDTESRWNRIRDLNFRWAATAAAGLGVVQGSVGQFLDDEGDDVEVKPGGPAPSVTVKYDPARFDPEGKVLLDLTRRPPARNCLFCHATRHPGTSGGASELRDRDVHLAAGFVCTDCHRNDLSHRITRGDGSAADLAVHPDNASLSCRGCHESGRLGSPTIEHAGLPGFHLERLTCTACHSGPLPASQTGLLQTARAHELGLLTKDDLDQRRQPSVRAPVFRRDAQGRVAPFFALWPAWWGVKKDGRTMPMALAAVREAKAKAGLKSKTGVLQAAEVSAILKALAGIAGGIPVYVAGGRVFTDGAAPAPQAPEAEPWYWPLAHDVRPARKALGAGGCTDCHSRGAAFFFGELTADPPDPGGALAQRPVWRDLGFSPRAVAGGAAAVSFRESVTRRLPLWLVILVASLALVRAVRPAVLRAPAAAPAQEPGAMFRWLRAAGFTLLAILAVTATGFVVTYGPSPLPGFFSSRAAVRLHGTAGLAFAVPALVLAGAWLWATARRRTAEAVARHGGFLWRGGVAASPRGVAAWIGFDTACCVALAASGIVMALRVPGWEAAPGTFLARIADSAWIVSAAYAAHGLAGTAMILRLGGYLWMRWAGPRGEARGSNASHEK